MSLRGATKTVVVAVLVLLRGLGSGSLPSTLALFVRIPAVVDASTSITTVIPCPAVRSPRLHVTVPAATRHVGEPGVVVTNLTTPGSVSVTTTPVEVDGPLFLTFST